MDLADRDIPAPQWPEFDLVHFMCGGNMFLLEKALNYWLVELLTAPVE